MHQRRVVEGGMRLVMYHYIETPYLPMAVSGGFGKAPVHPPLNDRKHSHHSNAIPQDTPNTKVIPGEHRRR